MNNAIPLSPMHTTTYSVQYDDFTAKVQLTGDWSLYHLAETLIDEVRFDFDHAFGFYDNLRNPYRSSEKYTLFADLGQPEHDEPGVEETMAADVFKPGKSMVLLFDYGDDWMFPVTCESVGPSKAKRASRKVLERKGKPPEQYPAEDW